MTTTPQATLLKDYQPSSFLINEVDLEIDIFDEHTIVKSSMQLSKNPAIESDNCLQLDGDELELIDVALDGQALDASRYQADANQLVINECPAGDFSLTITTKIYPQNNTALSGLYKSADMYCTQCEAQGFRRITYYLDRPDVLAKFTTRISADKANYPLLLSNGNPIDRGNDGERHFVTWQDPFPKPSYLFAVVAGDLESLTEKYTTASGRSVRLEIYVEKGKRSAAKHAMESLINAMRWDEEVYGREYDLDIYMIVAVSTFNMGAMENKGLNIFNDQFILAKPSTATDNDFINVESVVAHEYFHNWTGNRITCRDWFQLSLKEGLTVFRDQEFSADMNSRDVSRINDVNILRAHQFAEDAGPMAHPVRPQSYIEINNFYTSTVYNKGAEVIRMQHMLLGKEGFRRGMDLYFERHDGQAVTTDDFVQAMMDANDIDLTQFKNWYDYAGTPVVSVSTEYDEAKKSISLHFKQHVPDTPGQNNKPNFHIPIKLGLIDENGKEVSLLSEFGVPQSDVVSLTEKEQTITFYHCPKRVVPSLLRGFSAPIIMQADMSDDDLALLYAHDTDGFARYEAGQQLFSKTILSIYNALADGTATNVNQTVVDAYTQLVNQDMDDKALHALLMSLPSLAYLKSLVKEVDIARLHQARKILHAALLEPNVARLDFLYVQNRQLGSGLKQMDMAARRLKNTCLATLVADGDEDYLQLAYQQFGEKCNMTDALAALSCLTDHDCAQRQQALDEFYEQWSDNDLVLNKWFSVQAASQLPDALERVKGLLQHEKFTLKNPNRARALIGAFCAQNLLRFHDDSGAGYDFLAEQVIAMNAINPQVAARLVSPLTQWRAFKPHSQKLMQAALQKIADSDDLSTDVYELVTKSL